jgi:molecular chaperone DnaK (HSP70)
VPSRYLIGIDLGTTNSVVAYIDTQKASDADSPTYLPRTTTISA